LIGKREAERSDKLARRQRDKRIAVQQRLSDSGIEKAVDQEIEDLGVE